MGNQIRLIPQHPSTPKEGIKEQMDQTMDQTMDLPKMRPLFATNNSVMGEAPVTAVESSIVQPYSRRSSRHNHHAEVPCSAVSDENTDTNFSAMTEVPPPTTTTKIKSRQEVKESEQEPMCLTTNNQVPWSSVRTIMNETSCIGSTNDTRGRKDPRYPKWLEKYEWLKRFHEKHGHCEITKTLDHDEVGDQQKDLLFWVQHQRRMRRRGLLQKSREKLLNDIGFTWSPLSNEYRQAASNQSDEIMLGSECKKRKKPTLDSPFNDGPAQHLKEDTSNMPNKVLRRAGNEVKAVRVESRRKMHNPDDFLIIEEKDTPRLKKKLVNTTLHCDKDKNVVDSDSQTCKPTSSTSVTSIDNALNNDEGEKQTTHYVGPNEVMSSHRRSLDKKWLENYNKLRAFRERHGHCKVTQRDDEDKSLGVWVMKQRRARRVNELRRDRMKLLDAIGFEWGKAVYSSNLKDGPGTKWLNSYNKLKKFKEEHGHYQARLNHPDADIRSLALWIKVQRGQKRKNRLQADREKLLNDLGGFPWEIKMGEKKWEPRLNKKAALHARTISYDEDEEVAAVLLASKFAQTANSDHSVQEKKE